MELPLIDEAAFKELQDTTGHEFVAELVAAFLEEAPGMMAELRAAHAAGAAERFRRTAHSLKSNCITFGASRLAEQARALELGGMPESAAAIDQLEHSYSATTLALENTVRG